MTNRGIYAIVNHVTGAVYVGATSRSFTQRKREHWARLKHGRHHNRYLQRAWNKYGAAAFEFAMIQPVTHIQDLTALEQLWLDDFRLTTEVYNLDGNVTDSWYQKGKPYPAFVNRQTGEMIPTGINLAEMCRQRELHPEIMQQVATETKPSYRDWMLADRKHDESVKRTFPPLINRNTNEVVRGINNLAAFCKERHLDRSTLSGVIAGKRCQHKGWARLRGARIDGRTTAR